MLNPNRSSVVYISYLRATPLGASSRSLLANTMPIFSSKVSSTASLTISLDPSPDPNAFTGLAFQNPNLMPSNLTFELYSSTDTLLASATLTLPSGTRISREIAELLGGVIPPPGSYVLLNASAPVQMLGLSANDSLGTVLPFELEP